MPLKSRRLFTSIAFVLTATTASAQVSADQVWSDWLSYAESFGYRMTGTAARDGNVLTISGVIVSLGEENASAGGTVRMDRIVMTEKPDGTVVVDLPAVMPMEMSVPSETGGQSRVSMDYRQSGLNIVASGTPDNRRYDYSADSINVETTGLEVDGQALPPEVSAVEVVLDNLSGQSEVFEDSMRRYQQSLQIESVRYTMTAADAQTDSQADISGQWQSVGFEGLTTAPLRAMDASDMDAMLAAGLEGNGTFTYAANAMTFSAQSPEGPANAQIVSGAGSLGVRMGQDGLSYDVRQDDMKAEISVAQFQVPMNFDIAKSAFNLSVPVRQSDTPDDFAFGFEFQGFTMSEMLWAMFDPNAQLPRNPATIALDLTGKARLLFSLLDPATASAIGPDTAPAEVKELDINRLEIAAAGAELTGNGAFAFDNSAGPVPKPQGAIDLKLTGGNALIDKLVATGLLPEDQAMGVRMMMGLLAVPGATPDTLNSKIEINEQGHVLANGQRIQ